MQALEHELRTYIMENYLFGQNTVLSSNDSFLQLGVIDSTGVLELVSYLEERYGIGIAVEELVPENLDSIANLVRFIGEKQKALSFATGNVTANTPIPAGGKA